MFVGGALEKHAAFLRHIDDNAPALREVSNQPRNDELLVANLVVKRYRSTTWSSAIACEAYLRPLWRGD
jgi:hypothetical protein